MFRSQLSKGTYFTKYVSTTVQRNILYQDTTGRMGIDTLIIPLSIPAKH